MTFSGIGYDLHRLVEGRKLLIWEARVGQASGRPGKPGALASVGADGAVQVSAGEGSLIVTRAQFEGGPEGPARDILGLGASDCPARVD